MAFGSTEEEALQRLAEGLVRALSTMVEMLDVGDAADPDW
jgi:hypothetical protein